MTKSILITGSNGFTGRAISRAFSSKGMRVIEVCGPKKIAPGKISCDLTDKDSVFEALKGIDVDHVIHLAAISFVANDDIDAFYKTNVVGTCNLLECLADKNPQQVIISSSANVYGAPAISSAVLEDSPLLPINHYACSKLAMEHMARTFHDTLPIAIVRPFNYTGVGQDPKFLIPKIVKHFANKEPFIELGNLDISRDFTGIDDVVSAYISLVEHGVCNETFNISSGVSVSLREIIEELKEISGHDLDVRTSQKFVRSNEIKNLCGDSGKLQSMTGWRITQSISDILKSMLNSASDAS